MSHRPLHELLGVPRDAIQHIATVERDGTVHDCAGPTCPTCNAHPFQEGDTVVMIDPAPVIPAEPTPDQRAAAYNAIRKVHTNEGLSSPSEAAEWYACELYTAAGQPFNPDNHNAPEWILDEAKRVFREDFTEDQWRLLLLVIETARLGDTLGKAAPAGIARHAADTRDILWADHLGLTEEDWNAFVKLTGAQPSRLRRFLVEMGCMPPKVAAMSRWAVVCEPTGTVGDRATVVHVVEAKSENDAMEIARHHLGDLGPARHQRKNTYCAYPYTPPPPGAILSPEQLVATGGLP